MTNFIILFSLLFPDIYLQMYTLSYLTNRISFRKFFLTISIIFHLKVSAIEQNRASAGKKWNKFRNFWLFKHFDKRQFAWLLPWNEMAGKSSRDRRTRV